MSAIRISCLVFVPVWVILLFSTVLQAGYLSNSHLGISASNFLVNVVGLVSLCVGLYIGALYRINSSVKLGFNIIPVNTMLYILLAVSIAGASVTWGNWASLGIDILDFSSESFYEMNVIYAGEERISSGLFGRMNAAATLGVLLTVYALSVREISKFRAIILCFIFLVLLISPRRAAFINAALVGLIFYLLVNADKLKRPTAKSYMIIIFGACLLITLFGYTQSILGKSPEPTIASGISSVLSYIGTNLYVMEELLVTDHFDDTWIVLSTPALFMGQLLDVKPNVDLSIPFVYVPGPSNTVTVFYYFYKSGSWLGVVFFSVLVGFATTLSLNKYLSCRTFFYGSASSILLLSGILSIRECYYITYDFYYFIIMSYVISVLIKKT